MHKFLIKARNEDGTHYAIVSTTTHTVAAWTTDRSEATRLDTLDALAVHQVLLWQDTNRTGMFNPQIVEAR